MEADLVAGDTATVLQVAIVDRQSKAPINLTGCTPRLTWRIDGGTAVTRTMTIVDAVAGIASYQFDAGELTAKPRGSTFRGEVVVEEGSGDVLTQLLPITKTIRAKV